MRQSRLKVPSSQGNAVYHCVSRVVDRQFLFGPEENKIKGQTYYKKEIDGMICSG